MRCRVCMVKGPDHKPGRCIGTPVFCTPHHSTGRMSAGHLVVAGDGVIHPGALGRLAPACCAEAVAKYLAAKKEVVPVVA